MAAADVLLASISTPIFEPLDTTTTSSKRKWAEESPLVDNMPSLESPGKVSFDAEIHLNFEPPAKIHTMKELGFGDKGISPIAVSEPFQLFTTDAIKQMRSEVLSKPVWENCKYSSNSEYDADYSDMPLSSTTHGEVPKSSRLSQRLLE